MEMRRPSIGPSDFGDSDELQSSDVPEKEKEKDDDAEEDQDDDDPSFAEASDNENLTWMVMYLTEILNTMALMQTMPLEKTRNVK